eukprot:493198-Amphidinium_carterae.1
METDLPRKAANGSGGASDRPAGDGCSNTCQRRSMQTPAMIGGWHSVSSGESIVLGVPSTGACTLQRKAPSTLKWTGGQTTLTMS